MSLAQVDKDRLASALRAPVASSAFVLHRHDWSESSLILELFTLEKGRITALAKGAKRPHSQMRSVLLPFQRIHVAMTKGARKERDPTASDIQTLRSAEWAGGGAVLGGAALFSGFYMNELLMRLLVRHEARPRLFDAYVCALRGLQDPLETTAQAALRAFEVRLLSELGVLPDLSLCTPSQQAVRDDQPYQLTPDMGVIEVPSGSGADDLLPGALLISLQAALLHGSFPALQQACVAGLSPLKLALRGLLHYHLGFMPLRTRQIMLDMQAMERRVVL